MKFFFTLFWFAIICSLQAYPYFKEDQDINTHKVSSRICQLKSDYRFKEHPHLSIAEVQEQLHDRLLAKRVFSQVIGGFVGTLGGRNFHVASNTAAIALDYNMLPTLTDAATRAYVAQQALPALAIFLTTPQGMAVAAALGVAYWSKDKIIDFIKDDIGLLIKVYEMSMQAMAHAMDADMGAGKPKVNSTPIHQQNDQTLTTPMPEQQPILPGYEADPRATIADIEEFSVYNGPDMRVLEQLDGKLFQEHHIISNKHPATINHKLIKLAGFDLESSANKMFLPTRAGVEASTTVRSIHEGQHLESVSKSLAEEMRKAVDMGQRFGWNQPQYHAALMDIISAERQALKSGDRILNKYHRAFATDGGRVQPKLGGAQ